MSDQLKRSWAITKKNLSVYFLRGPVIIFGIVMPAFLFISFSLRRQIALESLIPGLLAMSLFFTVSSITPGIMPWETKMRTLERIVSSPVRLWVIILGDILSSFIYGTLITLIIYLIASAFLGQIIYNVPMLLGTFLAAFCFSSLGEMVSAIPTDNPSNVMMVSTLIKFPLIFISGIFISISEMGSLRTVSFFSPLTYYTDLLRGYIENNAFFSPSTNLTALFIFSILFFMLSLLLHGKNMSKRF